LTPDKTPPSVPRRVRQTVKAGAIALKWRASSDNKRLLGYEIFSGNKRIGFTPLNYFNVDKSLEVKRIKLMVRAVDLAGNESGLRRVSKSKQR